MVGNDPVGKLVSAFVRILGLRLQILDIRPKEIGLEVCLGSLPDAGETLKSGAGIDVLLRKRLVFASLLAGLGVELGEDDVP